MQLLARVPYIKKERKVKWEVDREGRNNRNNEQKQGHTQQPPQLIIYRTV